VRAGQVQASVQSIAQREKEQAGVTIRGGLKGGGTLLSEKTSFLSRTEADDSPLLQMPRDALTRRHFFLPANRPIASLLSGGITQTILPSE
jgi:hypothetical protein